MCENSVCQGSRKVTKSFLLPLFVTGDLYHFSKEISYLLQDNISPSPEYTS